MPSNYAQFDVTRRNGDGSQTPLSGVTVKVFNADNNTALIDLVTDSNGIIVAGSVNVPAGTRLRFRVENQQGLSGSITQITT